MLLEFEDTDVNWDYLWGRIVVRRKIAQFYDAYGKDFIKVYAKARCEEATILALQRELHIKNVPDWFERYFNARYKRYAEYCETKFKEE